MSIRIRVTNLIGGRKYISLDENLNATVMDIKLAYGAQHGVNIHRNTIVYSGVALVDSDSLPDVGIADNSNVYLQWVVNYSIFL